MTNPTPTPNQDSPTTNPRQALPGPLRSLSGALISGGFAIAFYFLTSSIAQTFANKPLTSTNPLTINIASAVRTLVVGVSTLAIVVFGVIAVGLVAVTIQVSIQRLQNRNVSLSDRQ